MCDAFLTLFFFFRPIFIFNDVYNLQIGNRKNHTRLQSFLEVNAICCCFFLFRMLSGFVEFDGYYLESDPCLVCNNPEVPFQV